MPDVAVNLEVWQKNWDWSQEGEEWSASWGGTPALWFGTLLPRIHSFIPTGTILEIAPGYGRWTQFLLGMCDQLVVVDLTPRCIEHCRERFTHASNIEYHVNDGRSLEMVADKSIDFVFSFDSLVHADADVLDAYLSQLARKLKPNGVGFFHHSNAAEYRALTMLTFGTPARIRRRLMQSGVLINIEAWRAQDMSTRRFRAQCDAAGLACVSQEKINWECGPYLTDALSIFTPRGSRWERSPRVTHNPLFRRESRRIAEHYAESSYPQGSGSRGRSSVRSLGRPF